MFNNKFKADSVSEAISKIMGGHKEEIELIKEDVEELDELSKKTVKSYVMKKLDSVYRPKEPVSTKQMNKDLNSMGRAHSRLTGVKPTSEDVEELDELSKKTLGSYIKANAADVAQRGTAASFKSGKAGDMYNKAPETAKDVKREKGMDKAIGKLTKEDSEMTFAERLLEKMKTMKEKKDSILVPEENKEKEPSNKMVKISTKKPIGFRVSDVGSGGKEHNVKTDSEWDKQHKTTKEEVEQIDELSKDTLNRYVGSAREKQGDRVKQVTQKTNAYHKTDRRTKDSKKLGREIEKDWDKTWKTADGINKALNRLTKEEVEQIEEKLGKGADASAWIDDFVHSKDPKFAGKSKEERKQQALAAYYGKQREGIEEAMDTYADIPAALRKKRGDEPLTPKEVKAPKPDTRSASGNVREAMDTKADIPAALRKSKKYEPLTLAQLKAKKHDTRSDAESLRKSAKGESVEEGADSYKYHAGEIDKTEKTTDTLRGRAKGGKDDDVGPAGNFKSTKVKMEAVEEKGEKEEGHEDEKEDKALVKKLVKPACLKTESSVLKLVKDASKKAHTRIKETLGIAPRSEVHEEQEALDEESKLEAYLKSIGKNAAYLTREQKIGISRSPAFQAWLQNH